MTGAEAREFDASKLPLLMVVQQLNLLHGPRMELLHLFPQHTAFRQLHALNTKRTSDIPRNLLTQAGYPKLCDVLTTEDLVLTD